MPNIQYSIASMGDDEFITVVIPGHPQPLAAGDDHPNYSQIVAEARSEDPDGEKLTTLFDTAASIADRFDSLSERVSVAHGRVYFDGDEVNDALTQQILRFLDEDVEDWKPLVNFFENVQANPNDHSREQLFSWLRGRDFTITDDGNFVGYKGVTSGEGGVPLSVNSGRAIVNGEVKTGRIPNPDGAVVEMPRSEVQHDPANGCSTGLHVGTYDFAKSFSHGKVLKLLVNPRDVVSVPTDSGAAKLRTCRYKVVKAVDAPVSGPVLDDAAWDDDYDGYDESDLEEWD